MKNTQGVIKIGRVSSVDVEKRTARVVFEDEDDMVSGPLIILQNHPTITIEREVDGSKWDYSASYSAADRKLGLGESYDKTIPDVIKLSKTIEYKKVNSVQDCSRTGTLEEKTHKETVKVHPWVPYIEQMVVCLLLAAGDGDGFIVGGF